MEEFLFFLFGAGVMGAAAAVTWVVRRRLRRDADRGHYQTRWQEAVRLLGGGGQLTAEQVARITGGGVVEMTLSRQPGTSGDRAATEITRAKKRLAPVDNLEGMTSGDQAAVRRARIRYGTEK